MGVNIYTDGEEEDVELHEYRWESAEEQLRSLKEVRRRRDNKEVTRSLKNLEKATQEKTNVMPYLLECCKSYATVGEMAGVFREVFGEFKEPTIF